MGLAIPPWFRAGNLLALVLLIVVVGAGPGVAVLLNLQDMLREERGVQAGTIAQQQAGSAGAAVINGIDGVAQVLTALSLSQRVQGLDPACGALLDRLRRAAPSYLVIAVVRRDGSAVCSSAAAPVPPDVLAGLVQPFLAAGQFVVGQYAMLAGLARPMLTLGLPIVDGQGGDPAVMVAGLDVTYFDGLLAAMHPAANGRLVLADRTGTVLARSPDAAAAVGSILGQPGALLAASQGGVAGPDHTQRVVGLASYGQAGGPGLFVSAATGGADLVSGFEAALDRLYLLSLLGAVLAVLLAAFVAQRYLRAPASVLLHTARRWGGGDLAARATMPAGAISGFTGLASAFNEMAALLQQQRAELQGLNDALEVRVAERTRALLDSNNRLQVEIAERELTAANLRQAQKLQAVGELSGGMAHEFNNLLTAILGNLDLLRKRLPGGDERQVRLLDTATEAVERGSRLTAQLLAFSRRQPLLAVSIDVADAIRGMAGLLASTLGVSTRLETRLDGEVWPAMLDPNQFEAAILNLALNARDAMPSGGRLILAAANVVVTPASAWSDLAPGDYVRVTVSDSGGGMSADVANRAFEPFFTTKAHGKGSGLGLAQVHGMVRQSGGSIAIQSRPGDGTNVLMMLPRSLAPPAAPSGALDGSAPALGRMEAILLVDDDDQVRHVTEAVLVDAGYTVVTAPDGGRALELLEARDYRIGLVIADYAMPGMTGRDLLQEVKRRVPGAAILLATGYADYPELTARELPIDQIIRKPFRSNELLARIHMVVTRQRSLAAAGDGAPAD